MQEPSRRNFLMGAATAGLIAAGSSASASPLMRMLEAEKTKRDERMVYEGSLIEFSKRAWPYVESAPFQPNWHFDMICEHLEAVANQQCLRLLINLPPRHGKSLLVNVFYQGWTWAQETSINPETGTRYAIEPETWRGPGVRFMCVTHKDTLASDHSVKARQVIECDWYQKYWSDRFDFVHDQNQKLRFDTTYGGSRIAGSTNMTGRGGNVVIYDDPHELMTAESELERAEVLRYWTEILPFRMNPGPGAFIIVMQRTHSRDLSGHIIAKEIGATEVDATEWAPRTWRHLCLPARFEPGHPYPLRTDLPRKHTTDIWRDQRAAGEALWPSAFPLTELDQRESGMTPYAIAGQLQQRPVPREGGLFKREWFGEDQFMESRDIPPGTKWVRHWDLAASDTPDADYTCGLKLGMLPDGRFLVGDVIRLQKEGHIVRKMITDTAAADGRHCEISIPKDPGQAGKVQAADFVKMLAGYMVCSITETGRKEVRAEPVAAQASHGHLLIKRATWNDEFLDELCMFPAAANDDQVDALSGAFARYVMPEGDFSWGYVKGLN